MAKNSSPASFESDEDAIIGKYTIAAMDKSEVFVYELLGPRLDPLNPSDLAITALDATPAQALSGALRAGDLVNLVISADPQSTQTVVIRGIRVLNAVKVPDEAYVVTLGLDAAQAAAYASTTLADWRLVREEAYQKP